MLHPILSSAYPTLSQFASHLQDPVQTLAAFQGEHAVPLKVNACHESSHVLFSGVVIGMLCTPGSIVGSC